MEQEDKFRKFCERASEFYRGMDPNNPQIEHIVGAIKGAEVSDRLELGPLSMVRMAALALHTKGLLDDDEFQLMADITMGELFRRFGDRVK